MSSKYADKQWQGRLFRYCKHDNVAALRKELFPFGELVVPQDLSEAKFQNFLGKRSKLLVSTSADLVEGNKLSEFLKVFERAFWRRVSLCTPENYSLQAKSEKYQATPLEFDETETFCILGRCTNRCSMVWLSSKVAQTWHFPNLSELTGKSHKSSGPRTIRGSASYLVRLFECVKQNT